MSTSTLGSRIKKLRLKRGLSQRMLAIAVNMRQPSISALEKGDSTWMRGDTLLRLADVLGVSADWLQNGEGDAKQRAVKPIDITLQLLIENYEQLDRAERDILLDLAKGLRRSRGKDKS